MHELALARKVAELGMTSACTVYKLGDPVTDPTSGEVVHPRTDVWSGRCRVRPAGLLSGESQAGGAPVVSAGFRISVPLSAVGIKRQQRVVIDSCPDDPDMVGRDMEIRDMAGGEVTARRLLCEEVE